jgi:hypothetical protein
MRTSRPSFGGVLNAALAAEGKTLPGAGEWVGPSARDPDSGYTSPRLMYDNMYKHQRQQHHVGAKLCCCSSYAGQSMFALW